jgi:hypothetical protein
MGSHQIVLNYTVHPYLLMGSQNHKDGTADRTAGSVQLVPAHPYYLLHFTKIQYHKILKEHMLSGANTASTSEVNMVTTVILLMESKA